MYFYMLFMRDKWMAGWIPTCVISVPEPERQIEIDGRIDRRTDGRLSVA